jgi:hypothetical protein
MAKGRKGRRGSRRISKNTQKMTTGSCMFGGESAHYAGNGSGATGYGTAIFGDRGSQVADGMGGNHIKLNDPAVAWKGGNRGGSMLGAAIVPAALLAANQLYKPSRAIKNVTFGRKKGFRKTMKKMMSNRRR